MMAPWVCMTGEMVKGQVGRKNPKFQWVQLSLHIPVEFGQRALTGICCMGVCLDPTCGCGQTDPEEEKGTHLVFSPVPILSFHTFRSPRGRRSSGGVASL